MKDKTIFIIGIMVALVIVTISGGLYYKSTKLIVVSEKTVSNKPVPVATTKPEATVSNYKEMEVSVLNGSGIAGKAKKYATDLKALGYTNVKTGNYTETVTGNLLFAPEETIDFKTDLKSVSFENYKYTKSDVINVVIGH